MAVFRNETITGERIVLDDNTYDNCTLIDCEIVYRGGNVNLTFKTEGACRWVFQGCALNTIKVLQALNVFPLDPKQVLITGKTTNPKSAQ